MTLTPGHTVSKVQSSDLILGALDSSSSLNAPIYALGKPLGGVGTALEGGGCSPLGFLQ